MVDRADQALAGSSPSAPEPARFKPGDFVEWSPTDFDIDVRLIQGFKEIHGEGPYEVVRVVREWAGYESRDLGEWVVGSSDIEINPTKPTPPGTPAHLAEAVYGQVWFRLVDRPGGAAQDPGMGIDQPAPGEPPEPARPSDAVADSAADEAGLDPRFIRDHGFLIFTGEVSPEAIPDHRTLQDERIDALVTDDATAAAWPRPRAVLSALARW
jgi:hypothetical protein